MLLFDYSRNLLSVVCCVRWTMCGGAASEEVMTKKKRLRGDSGVFFYVDFVPEFYVRGK